MCVFSLHRICISSGAAVCIFRHSEEWQGRQSIVWSCHGPTQNSFGQLTQWCQKVECYTDLFRGCFDTGWCDLSLNTKCNKINNGIKKLSIGARNLLVKHPACVNNWKNTCSLRVQFKVAFMALGQVHICFILAVSEKFLMWPRFFSTRIIPYLTLLRWMDFLCNRNEICSCEIRTLGCCFSPSKSNNSVESNEIEILTFFNKRKRVDLCEIIIYYCCFFIKKNSWYVNWFFRDKDFFSMKNDTLLGSSEVQNNHESFPMQNENL